MILHSHKLAIQTGLNKLFGYFRRASEAPTTGAYCRARHKLDPKLFQHLIAQVSEEFYTYWGEDDEVETWHGWRVKAIDSSRLHVPDTPETREHYTVQENQFPDAVCVQAMMSVCYDVLNDVGLSVGLRAICAEKEFVWTEHAASIGGEDLVVLDRGYTDYSVLAWLEARAGAYVIRCRSNGFGAIKRFLASKQRDQIVTLKVTSSAKAFVAKHGLASTLQVRLVKIALPSGETEVLATNLLDQKQVRRADLGQVYNLRWGIETFYDRVKDVYEVERISGQGRVTIEQDVYGVVFLATLESIVGKEAEQELKQMSQERDHRYVKQVNHAVSSSALIEQVVAILCDEQVEVEEVYERLRVLFKKNPTSIRPGRQYPRKKGTYSRRLRYYRYRKRLSL